MNRNAESTDESPSEGAEPVTWQAQKSASTRKQIIEAAVRCFIEIGYARTTTTAIAEKAGLSRGAMLHHFPSKIDIVRAAVDYLHNRRLKAVRKAASKLSPTHRDRVHQSVDAYWQQVRHPMFLAFFELTVAARTDPELAAILQPAQEAFDRQWYETTVEVFPEWKGTGENFDLALDLSHYLIEGMAVNLMSREPTERDKRLLHWLEERLRELAGREGPPGDD
jgi:AcrR family transcriptional regulator